MLLPFKCGIPKQLCFGREEAFVSAFILELSHMLSSGGEGRAWTSALCLFLSRRSCATLFFPQVAFLCTDGMREMGQ